MRETIAEWSFKAYTILLPFAWIGLAIVALVLIPLALNRSTRGAGGIGLLIASWLFGVTAWFLGAGVTFASFGWIGLIIGLFMFGIVALCHAVVTEPVSSSSLSCLEQPGKR